MLLRGVFANPLGVPTKHQQKKKPTKNADAENSQDAQGPCLPVPFMRVASKILLILDGVVSMIVLSRTVWSLELCLCQSGDDLRTQASQG